MDEALKQLALEVRYCTGPLATTDLHAGGVFFCVVYRDCLQFSSGGLVRRWCEVLDDSRIMDDEAKLLRATDVVGTYRLNDRGYVSCVFPNLELTGLLCTQAPELLAFHAWRPHPGVSFSLVYTRDKSDAEQTVPSVAVTCATPR